MLIQIMISIISMIISIISTIIIVSNNKYRHSYSRTPLGIGAYERDNLPPPQGLVVDHVFAHVKRYSLLSDISRIHKHLFSNMITTYYGMRN